MIKQTLRKLLWIEELLPIQVLQTTMKGGVGYYMDEKLVLILVESGTSYEHKGISYPFKIWDGCFFPIEKIKQNAVFAKFPFLENHPALSDSLYLPADSEDFIEQVQLLLREIKKQNPLFGIRINKKRPSKKSNDSEDDEHVDTSQPSLFSDRPKVKKSQAPKLPSSLPKPVKKKTASKKFENDMLLSVLKRSSKKVN